METEKCRETSFYQVIAGDTLTPPLHLFGERGEWGGWPEEYNLIVTLANSRESDLKRHGPSLDLPRIHSRRSHNIQGTHPIGLYRN